MNEAKQCASQRIDEINSEIIRTRARLLQLQREVSTLQIQFAREQVATVVADATAVDIIPLSVLERAEIENAVRLRGIMEAARALGVGKTTIYRKLREYGWNLRLLQHEERSVGGLS